MTVIFSSKLFCSHVQIDTVEIKEEYNKLFSTSLAGDISQNFNGNLSSLLLALIKGTVYIVYVSYS